MPRKGKSVRAGSSLRRSEATALRELTARAGLQGHLREGALIRGGRLGEDVRFASRKGSVLALSLRRCGLTSLPESLAQLQGLRQLDLEGNRFSELPGPV